MEGLKSVVNDPQIMQQFLDEKFDDDSLPYVNETHMTKMGIPLGIQLKVLIYAEKLRKAANPNEPTPSTSTQLSASTPATSIQRSAPIPSKPHAATKYKQDEIKKVLEDTPKSRHIFYELNDKGELTRKELTTMVGTVCDHYFYASVMSGDYPSTAEKRELARSLIDIYPHLGSDKPDQPESELFTTVGGVNKGLVEQHIKTLRGHVKIENRLFTRKPAPALVPVSDELIQKSYVVANYPSTPEYQPYIAQGMGELHELLQFLINSHESLSKIISTLPKLLTFNGQMILECFDRIQKNASAAVPINKVLARALLLPKRQLFSEIRDEYIRACLFLMKEMPVRGAKREIESEYELNSTEILAAPLIRWIKNDDFTEYMQGSYKMHIVCVGNEEHYFVYIKDGQKVEIGQDSCRAIETLMKSFVVLGQKVPLFLTRLYEFLSVVCFGSQLDPTVQCVVKCIQKFKLCHEKEA